MEFSSLFRKWCRTLHRDVSMIFAGAFVVYAVSGIFMNHRDTINPNYSVERTEFQTGRRWASKADVTMAQVTEILSGIDEADNYAKHYFPKPGEMKIFLKGGSSVVVNMTTGMAVYEKLQKRVVVGSMVRLHYNPGKAWTVFADCFAVSMILIVLSGILMFQGRQFVRSRMLWELIAGILIPILFIII